MKRAGKVELNPLTPTAMFGLTTAAAGAWIVAANPFPDSLGLHSQFCHNFGGGDAAS